MNDKLTSYDEVSAMSVSHLHYMGYPIREIEMLVIKRWRAKNGGDYKESDLIREKLLSDYNICLEDGKGFTRWGAKNRWRDRATLSSFSAVLTESRMSHIEKEENKISGAFGNSSSYFKAYRSIQEEEMANLKMEIAMLKLQIAKNGLMIDSLIRMDDEFNKDLQSKERLLVRIQREISEC